MRFPWEVIYSGLGSISGHLTIRARSEKEEEADDDMSHPSLKLVIPATVTPLIWVRVCAERCLLVMEASSVLLVPETAGYDDGAIYLVWETAMRPLF